MSNTFIEAERASRFNRRIRLVTAAGIKLPPKFLELRQRLDDFTQTQGAPIRGRLSKAIIDNDTKADVALLYAAALAEANPNPQLRAELNDLITADVHAQLRWIYGQEAQRNYEQLANEFDQHAAAFTQCADQVDIEATADVVANLPGADLQAWRDALTHANAMTKLLAPLHAAATLAGTGSDVEPDELLPLTVDVEGHDRQQIWQAWDCEATEKLARDREAAGDIFSRPTVPHTRTGRWGALLRMNATIRACKLIDFRPYSRRETEPFAPNTTHSIGRVPDRMLQ